MAKGEDTSNHPGRKVPRESYFSRVLGVPGVGRPDPGGSVAPTCRSDSISCYHGTDPTVHLHPSGEFISTGLGVNHFVNRDDRLNEVRGGLNEWKRRTGG